MLIYIGIALALSFYAWIIFHVGTSRGRYGVTAPATSGHEV